MKQFQTPAFTEIALDELHARAASYKQQGHSFVQICATLLEDGCELLYTFQDPSYSAGGMEGLLVKVPDGAHVPSITDLYPAAFVFENETHDLFGVPVDNINIDFQGEFYTVAVAYPMNPRAAEAADKAATAAEGEESSDE